MLSFDSIELKASMSGKQVSEKGKWKALESVNDGGRPIEVISINLQTRTD